MGTPVPVKRFGRDFLGQELMRNLLDGTHSIDLEEFYLSSRINFYELFKVRRRPVSAAQRNASLVVMLVQVSTLQGNSGFILHFPYIWI